MRWHTFVHMVSADIAAIGDIEYKGFAEDTGTVRVALKGSCRGCDSSTVTLKNGIERMLMHYVRLR